MTDPDWEPVMRRVAGIVTDKGGRTAHAAIVSREFGLPCIVGTDVGTTALRDGDEVTVCCAEGAEGHVYAGKVPFTIDRVDSSSVPQTHTKVMLIVGDPSRAFDLSRIPNAGVGLARAEFIITNHIGIHPMALARYPQLTDPQTVSAIAGRIGCEQAREFFVGRFSEGIARIAAAFYPKPVIVRTSDFKTNEYAQLLGGQEFEPREENPMIGFRRGGPPAWQADRDLRPGAVGLPGICGLAGRPGDRLHLVESGRGGGDHDSHRGRGNLDRRSRIRLGRGGASRQHPDSAPAVQLPGEGAAVAI